MVEVLIYATAEDAEQNLEKFILENVSSLNHLKNNLEVISSCGVRKKCSALTSSTALNCVFFLNKEEGRYDFSYGVKNMEDGISQLTCDTIEELVSEIKNCLSAGEIFGKYCSYGIKINPVFYTVIEPEVLTESERKKVSNALGWEVNSVGADGLSADEIEKFVSLY